MVWQLVVLPGTHTVTVVNRVLTSELVLVGPESTTTLTALEADGAGPPGDSVLPPPPPPPPHESADRHKAAHAPKRHARADVRDAANLTISANLPR
jgi:hypothetical protein